MVTPATSLPIFNLGSNDPASGAPAAGEGPNANTTDFATALVQAHSQLPRTASAKSAATPSPTAKAAATANASEDSAPNAEASASATTPESAPVDPKGKEVTDLEDTPAPTQALGTSVPYPQLPYSLLTAGLAQPIPVAASKEITEETAIPSGDALPGGKTVASGLTPSVGQRLESSAATGFPTQDRSMLSAAALLPNPTALAAKTDTAPSTIPIDIGASMDSNAALRTASGVDFAPAVSLGQGLDIGNAAIAMKMPTLPQNSNVSQNNAISGALQTPPAVTSAATSVPVVESASITSPASLPATDSSDSTGLAMQDVAPTGRNIPAPMSFPANIALANAVAASPNAPIPTNERATEMRTSTAHTANSAVVTTSAPAGAATPTGAATPAGTQTASNLERSTAASVAAETKSEIQTEARRTTEVAQRLSSLERLQTIGASSRSESTAIAVGTPSSGSDPMVPGPPVHQATGEPSSSPQLGRNGASTGNPLTHTANPSFPSASASGESTSHYAFLQPSTLNAALSEQPPVVAMDKPVQDRGNADVSPSPGRTIPSSASALQMPTAFQQGSSEMGRQGGDRPAEEEASEASHTTAQGVVPTVGGDSRFPSVNADTVTAPSTHEASAASTTERVRIAEQVTRHLETLRLPAGQSEMSLRLHPEHLGSLHLRLTVQGDGVVARIVAENSQVQQALESQKESLRSALEGRGMHLTALEVTVGQQSLPEGRTGFNAQQNMAQQRGGQPSGLRSSGSNAATEAVVAPVSRSIGLDSRTSRLDYRA